MDLYLTRVLAMFVITSLIPEPRLRNVGFMPSQRDALNNPPVRVAYRIALFQSRVIPR